MTDLMGYLVLSEEDAKELYLALGTRAYVLQQTGKPYGRVKSLQGRVDNIWAEIEHAEKSRGGSRKEIRSDDAMEGLAPDSVFVPDAG